MAALLGSFTDAYGFVTLLEKPVVVVQVQSMQAADLQPMYILSLSCCRFTLPVSTPSACAFAGSDLSVLYITTIDDKSKCKGAGGLWSYKLPGLSGWSASHIAKPLN